MYSAEIFCICSYIYDVGRPQQSLVMYMLIASWKVAMTTLAVNADYSRASVATWDYVHTFNHLVLLLYILFMKISIVD